MLGWIFKKILTAMGKRRLPRVDGEITLPGLCGPVEILRDRWGIPHVYADSLEDLFFAQGFIHSQDRLWQMELNRRTGTGTLSELFGAMALDTDRAIRVFGWQRLGSEDYHRLSGDTKRVVDCYVKGINAFLAHGDTRLPVELALLGHKPKPWTPLEVMAFSRVMIWMLDCSWYSDLVRARVRRTVGEEHAAELELRYPKENPLTLDRGIEFNVLDPEGTLRGAAGPFLKRGKGSNAWAVSGSRTSTGKPFLCNDMHLEVGIPSLWYEVHLVGGGINATGVSLPGLPLVMVGHNHRIAWGITLAYTDSEDLFVEKLDPEKPDAYLYRGERRAADIREEIISVKGRKEPHVEKVTVTHHGPVISEIAETLDQKLAVSSMSLRPCTTLDGWLRLNRARGWDDFVQAMELLETPTFNIAYADVDGNIGYWNTGKLPVRAKGDGMVPVPGWTGEYEWVGEIPFQEMPHALNPEKGFVVTCNNRIVGDDFPHFLGNTFLNGYRARRITEQLENGAALTAEHMRAMQLDLISLPGRRFVEAVSTLEPEAPGAAAAIGILRDWDGALTADGVPGAVYKVAAYHFLRFIFEPKLGSTLTDQLVGEGYHRVLQSESDLLGRDSQFLVHFLDNPDSWWVRDAGGLNLLLEKSIGRAVEWLGKELGSDPGSWKWGRIHALTLAHAMGMKKPLDKVFNLGPVPIGGDTDTPLQTAILPGKPYSEITTAPSHRQIIDLGDLGKSMMIHTPGQSGQLGSRHYADLLPMWREGEYHPMLWERKDIENQMEGKLILTPWESLREETQSTGTSSKEKRDA